MKKIFVKPWGFLSKELPILYQTIRVEESGFCRRVYYHPKTKLQIASLVLYRRSLIDPPFQEYNWHNYFVSFPKESRKSFTFRIDRLSKAERFIARECFSTGKLYNRVVIALANAQCLPPIVFNEPH